MVTETVRRGGLLVTPAAFAHTLNVPLEQGMRVLLTTPQIKAIGASDQVFLYRWRSVSMIAAELGCPDPYREYEPLDGGGL